MITLRNSAMRSAVQNSFETQSAAHARRVKWKLQAGWEELHDSQWRCTQRALLWVIDDNIYQLIIINEMAGIVNIHSGSIGYSFRCIHSWCRPIHPLNRMNIINTEHEALKSVFYLLIKAAKALRIWVLSLSTILWSFFGSIELHFTFVVPIIQNQNHNIFIVEIMCQSCGIEKNKQTKKRQKMNMTIRKRKKVKNIHKIINTIPSTAINEQGGI